jgi:hypothetical protein
MTFLPQMYKERNSVNSQNSVLTRKTLGLILFAFTSKLM